MADVLDVLDDCCNGLILWVVRYVLIVVGMIVFFAFLQAFVGVTLFDDSHNWEGGIIIVGALVINIAITIKRFMDQESMRKAIEEAARKKDELSDSAYKNWLEHGFSAPYATGEGLSLYEGEALYFKESNVELYEAKTQKSAITGGVGYTFENGVSLGAGMTEFIQWQDMTCIATGMLYVTNMRVSFVSDMQTRNVLLSNIVSIDSCGRYGLIVCSSDLVKSQNFKCVGARIYSEAVQAMLRC